MLTCPPCAPSHRLRLHTRRCVNTYHVICLSRVPCIQRVWRPCRTSTPCRPGRSFELPAGRADPASINWPAWFRHFKAVADVHGWDKDKDQRALQLVSYLNKTAMNVAQELSDQELYNYDVLVKLLGDRFDPASRVSASRSRFHGRTRSHHEDADTFADSITELCRLGYPQSSPELHQELISEQFVRGQSDSELKKYLWVVIRTQKDRKLQTFIEVCTDFASLGQTTSVHRPAEQIFALEEDDDWEEDMVAMVDRSQWATQGYRNHLCHRIYGRCSPSHAAWDTRCDRLLVVRMLLVGRRDPRRHEDRDIARRIVRVATTPR